MGKDRFLWDNEKFHIVATEFSKSKSINEALRKVKTVLGRSFTYKALSRAFNRFGHACPGILLQKISKYERPVDTYGDKSLDEFIQFTNKKKYSFSELCNLLDISPRRLEEFIEKAKEMGYVLNVSNERVAINKEIKNQNKLSNVKIPIREGSKIRFGVISDTHFGSKAALPEYVTDFVNSAYKNYGVRTIIHCGDILTGDSVFKSQVAELDKWGLQSQCDCASNALPKLKDLNYYMLLGNHDVDFIKQAGIDPGFVLESIRSDFHALGTLKSMFTIENTGINVEVLHIKSKAHAKSYALEKHIAKTVSKQHCPDIIFCGHLHTSSYFILNNIHCFMVPCFEDANLFVDYNDFVPSIGGIVVEITVNKNNEIVQCIPIFDLYNQKTQKTKTIKM